MSASARLTTFSRLGFAARRLLYIVIDLIPPVLAMPPAWLRASVPWGYVWANYVRRPGERWTRRTG